MSHSQACLFSKGVYTNKVICPIHILIFTEFFIFILLTAEKKEINMQKECEGFGSHSGDRNVRAHYVIHIYQCCTGICDLKGTRMYHFSIYLP